MFDSMPKKDEAPAVTIDKEQTMPQSMAEVGMSIQDVLEGAPLTEFFGEKLLIERRETTEVLNDGIEVHIAQTKIPGLLHTFSVTAETPLGIFPTKRTIQFKWGVDNFNYQIKKTERGLVATKFDIDDLLQLKEILKVVLEHRREQGAALN